MPANSLCAAAPNSCLSNTREEVEWNGLKSTRIFHLFVNETRDPVDLYWFYEGGERHHTTIQPSKNAHVGSYTFHSWKLKSKDGTMLGVHTGPSATVTVSPKGCLITFNTLTAQPPPGYIQAPPKGGAYAQRGEVLGMPIWASECVSLEAVHLTAHVVSRMLEHSPASLVEQMQKAGSALAIVGRDQGVTDIPPHAFMRYNSDRDINATARGLGATPDIPVTSVGEENVLMDRDKLYPCQSILVHEFGHAVMNLVFGRDKLERLVVIYNEAVKAGNPVRDCYMMSNEQEFWATAVEAWFESNIRVDVNGGINTRAKLRETLPALGEMMEEVFGDGPWRYTHDCPRPLTMRKRTLDQARNGETAGACESLPTPATAALPGSTPPSISTPAARTAAAEYACAASTSSSTDSQLYSATPTPDTPTQTSALSPEQPLATPATSSIPLDTHLNGPSSGTSCRVRLAAATTAAQQPGPSAEDGTYTAASPPEKRHPGAPATEGRNSWFPAPTLTSFRTSSTGLWVNAAFGSCVGTRGVGPRSESGGSGCLPVGPLQQGWRWGMLTACFPGGVATGRARDKEMQKGM